MHGSNHNDGVISVTATAMEPVAMTPMARTAMAPFATVRSMLHSQSSMPTHVHGHQANTFTT